jgi:arabinofuranan 3-O-arabinosyltransferase
LIGPWRWTQFPSGRLPSFPLTRPVELACFALCVANAVLVGSALIHGDWLVGLYRLPVATDFVNFYAAVRQVVEGHPDLAYVSAIHKAVEAETVGHPFDGDYPLIHPPTFLLVATPLALIPYVQAYVAWVVLTFFAYVLTVRRIVGYPLGVMFAFAYPGIVSNMMVGQNGFATTALLASTLLLMQRRPVLAGCLLGALSFKPHLGILFPIVLVADQRWRVIAGATAVVVLLAVASVLAFGIETWEAFFRSLTLVSHAVLVDGVADFTKLQSLFAVIRALGGGENVAWMSQAVLAGTVAIVLCAMWRTSLPFDLKAAALASGTLLASPYVFIYDLAALAVPMAYLLRAVARTGALAGEMPALGAACLMLFAFPFVKAPIGLGAVLIVAALVARRAFRRGVGSEPPTPDKSHARGSIPADNRRASP